MENSMLAITEEQGVVSDTQIKVATEVRSRSKQNLLLSEKRLYAENDWIFGGGLDKKRCGAYGVFTVTNDLTKYTKARFLNRTGKKTLVFLVFSEAAPYAGIGGMERGVCAFSTRFYTEDGIWDSVGCNLPVSFTCHPQKYLDGICSQRPKTEKARLNLAEKWNVWSLFPDSLHQIMFLMGERGIPRDYRHMHCFGCRTYNFINEEGRHFLAKFHLLTQQGILNLSVEELLRRKASYHISVQRDLYDNIKKGNHPKWKLYIQLMPEEDAGKCSFNPYDLTKVWPHKEYPLIEAGTLELQRVPIKDSVEVNNCGFCSSNLVPGIEFPSHICHYQGKTDYYWQPGAFFRLQSAEAQRRIIHNVVRELARVPEYIQIRATARFYQADRCCGEKIAKELQFEIRLILEEIEWQKEADMSMAF
ncbi:MAG: catalase [Bacteroides sp.]|nr:catalase [Bacteroides sp.]